MSRDSSNAEFGARLAEAFGTESIPEIAARLGTTYQVIKNYFTGRLPAAEMLIAISKQTGISIHWLLTGTGLKRITDVTPSPSTQAPQQLMAHADRLLKAGITRTSALLLGVVIEMTLRTLSVAYTSGLKDEPPASELIEVLNLRGVITNRDRRKLVVCQVIAEKALMNPVPPTGESVSLMAAYTKEIVDGYILGLASGS
jgi:hypothetical protein